MLRRIIYFFLVIVLLGGLGGAIAWYAFDFKPKMIAGFIMSAPKPVETVSAMDLIMGAAEEDSAKQDEDEGPAPA